MKAWIIYYIGNDDSISPPYKTEDSKDNQNNIYAITCDKKLFHDFMSIRDSNVFKIRKVDILPSEYEELISEFRDCVIDNFTLITRKENDSGVTNVFIPITQHEYNSSTDDTLLDLYFLSDDWWSHSLPVKVVNSKLKKALDILQYTNSQKLMNIGSLSDADDDYSAPDIELDEFHVFTLTFGSTLSKTL
ncbi:hypothetical protein IKN40_06620 [bacterium]|nr:hypothetical protein [bacterium]